jgi:CRISPR-associated exonuclease Cas4
MDENWYLPISKINTVVFCARRFYLEFVLGEVSVNHHILEGRALHEGAYTEKTERSDVWVWHDTLGLIGILDRIETGTNGERIPVEYKIGQRGDHESDAVQLCAQALCLEQSGPSIHHGFVYYHATRRRREVVFDTALRERTLAAVLEMRELMAAAKPPAVNVPKSKCAGCSVRPACQPELWRSR